MFLKRLSSYIFFLLFLFDCGIAPFVLFGHSDIGENESKKNRFSSPLCHFIDFHKFIKSETNRIVAFLPMSCEFRQDLLIFQRKWNRMSDRNLWAVVKSKCFSLLSTKEKRKHFSPKRVKSVFSDFAVTNKFSQRQMKSWAYNIKHTKNIALAFENRHFSTNENKTGR